MSRRTQRVGSLIRSILADAIQNRLSDPRISTITSLTRVEVSDDFSVARVFVSVLAPEARRELCLRGLQSAAAHLRRMLGSELRLRKIPTLDFRLDDSLRRGFETVQAIDRVMRELGEGPEWERGDARTVEGETEHGESRAGSGSGEAHSPPPRHSPSRQQEDA